MLAANSMTHEQIAKLIGVSRNIVSDVNQTLKQVSINDLDAQMTIYRQELQRVIPIPLRVNTLREVIQEKNNPFARLRAVQHVDQMSGLITSSDKDARQPIPQALFSLPAGSVIHIEAGGQVCDAARTNTPSQIPDNVIDITPNSPDSTDST
jgi:hypothetical protein